jgi:hypothetical protein
MVHNAGHTVILSWGQGGSGSDYKKATRTPTGGLASAGYADTQLKNMFARSTASDSALP